MYNMPKVNTENAKNKLAGNEEGLAILDIIVKKDGTVRASKPKVTDDPITGKAAYVWRYVCFLVSPKPAHQCMPCTADYDLPAYDENGKWRYQLARKMGETLDLIEKVIVDSVNKDEWHGVHRWGRILS
jgi:hypothetical protein